MLYIGEEVGAGGPEVDIAVDPIEGTNLVAKGQNGLMQHIAPRGCLLHALICTWIKSLSASC